MRDEMAPWGRSVEAPRAGTPGQLVLAVRDAEYRVVFGNFADPELEHWTDAYYGPNYDRLIRIKAQYDASNIFHFSQSLPVLP
jgi:hypothetical protein